MICDNDGEDQNPIMAAETRKSLADMLWAKVFEAFAEEESTRPPLNHEGPLPAFLDAKEERQGLFMRLIKGGK